MYRHTLKIINHYPSTLKYSMQILSKTMMDNLHTYRQARNKCYKSGLKIAYFCCTPEMKTRHLISPTLLKILLKLHHTPL